MYKTKGIWNGFLARKILHPFQEFLASGKTNEIWAGQEGHLTESRQSMLSALFSLKVQKWSHYYLDTHSLFFIITESGLAECFSCQATAEPIFISEISMSHKINPKPTVPSMDVSWIPHSIYQTTSYFLLHGESSSRCAACCLKLLSSLTAQTSPVSTASGQGCK